MSYDVTYIKEDLDELALNNRRHEISRLLGSYDCEVTFTKVDGSVRVMPCTLRSDAMPTKILNEHHQTRLLDPAVIRVFCLDQQAWRSFRVANVTHVRVLV